MRGCWNWQTGHFEVVVSYARMGSSPISRTKGFDSDKAIENYPVTQPPPTEIDCRDEVSVEESVVVSGTILETDRIMGNWWNGRHARLRI